MVIKPSPLSPELSILIVTGLVTATFLFGVVNGGRVKLSYGLNIEPCKCELKVRGLIYTFSQCVRWQFPKHLFVVFSKLAHMPEAIFVGYITHKNNVARLVFQDIIYMI